MKTDNNNILIREVLIEKHFPHIRLIDLRGFEYEIIDNVFHIYLHRDVVEKYHQLSTKINTITGIRVIWKVRIDSGTYYGNHFRASALKYIKNGVVNLSKYKINLYHRAYDFLFDEVIGRPR